MHLAWSGDWFKQNPLKRLMPLPAVGDSEFWLLAKQVLQAGGTLDSTDNKMTLLAKNNVLLGGAAATSDDNLTTLLSRQNKLLGGTGASAGDNEFTLYAKNNKLLGGSGAQITDTVIPLLSRNLIGGQAGGGPGTVSNPLTESQQPQAALALATFSYNPTGSYTQLIAESQKPQAALSLSS